MPGIGIITNPHSKQNKRNPERAELLSYIVGTKGKLAITEDLEHLKQVAEHFRDSDVEVLAINGGDGTISRTLTAFIESYGDKPLPKIALLRGGTMNVLAANLGLRGRPERLLYKLVEGYSSIDDFSVKTLKTIKVGNHYGFVYADGVAERFLVEFYRNKKHWIAAGFFLVKVLFSSVFKGRLFRKIVTADDSRISINDYNFVPVQTTAIFISTIEKLSFGARLFKELRYHSHRFECLLVNSSPNWLIWHLPRLLLRRFPGAHVKESICSQNIKIHRHSQFAYSLDGELHQAHTDTLEVSLGPDVSFLRRF